MKACGMETKPKPEGRGVKRGPGREAGGQGQYGQGQGGWQGDGYGKRTKVLFQNS